MMIKELLLTGLVLASCVSSQPPVSPVPTPIVCDVEWADLEYSIPLYPAGEYLLTFEAKSVEQYGEHALVVGVEVNTGQVVEMGEYQGELLIVGTLYTVRAIFMSSQDGRPIFALIEVVKVESVVEPTPAIIGDQV